MDTLDATNAFLIDEPLATSSAAVVSASRERQIAGDLHSWMSLPHILEVQTSCDEQQKTVRTEISQYPSSSSVQRSSLDRFWSMMGNPELRPAAVPPEQLNGTHQQAITACGELALMRAVLSDAIDCYRKLFITKNWRTQRLGNEAMAWFAANDEHWPFSFINICRALALDPDYIRRGLKLWRQRMSTVQAVEA